MVRRYPPRGLATRHPHSARESRGNPAPVQRRRRGRPARAVSQMPRCPARPARSPVFSTVQHQLLRGSGRAQGGERAAAPTGLCSGSLPVPIGSPMAMAWPWHASGELWAAGSGDPKSFSQLALSFLPPGGRGARLFHASLRSRTTQSLPDTSPTLLPTLPQACEQASHCNHRDFPL